MITSDKYFLFYVITGTALFLEKPIHTRISLKRRFGGCGQGFGGCNGPCGFSGFDGFNEFGGFDGLGGFSGFDG